MKQWKLRIDAFSGRISKHTLKPAQNTSKLKNSTDDLKKAEIVASDTTS